MHTTSVANQDGVSLEIVTPTLASTSSSTLQTSTQLATMSVSAVPEAGTEVVVAEGKKSSLESDGSNQDVSIEENYDSEYKNDANDETELAKDTGVVRKSNSSSRYSPGTLLILTFLGTAVNLVLNQ